MTDITQKLIAESDGLYYTFFNSMNEGLAICEIILAKNGEPDDYRHLDVNPAFEKIIGIPASRIRGKNQREFGYADPFWLELFGEVLKTGIPLSREDYSSGLGKWFDLRAFSLGGKKFGFQLMDVTERKRMEEALQASETRLKGIFEFSPIGIELYDSNGKITFQERITKWLNGEKPDPNVEYKVRVKDGHEVCVLLNVTFATDEDGNPIRATVVCYDITERKKMEEELAFQGRLLASVHDAISAADENYIITYWNDMAEKIFGWTAQETMGQSSQKIFRTVVPNSSREEAINQMLKDDYYTGEVIYHHKDGTEIYTSVHAKVLRGLNGEFKGNITSFRDITERKKTEEALRQNENKFRLLAENVSDVIWVLNLTLGKFTYISPSVYQLRGYSPEEAMQQSIQESLTPESAQTVFENIPIRIKNSAEAPVHHEVYTDQLRQPCKDGKIIWIETTTKYQYNSAGEIEVVGVSRDITKRKQLEEQLYTTARLTEQRANELDGIISSVAGGLVIYDITGQIIRMNEFAQKIFNYVQDDYLNPFQERIVNLKMYKSDGTAYKTEERPLYRALLGEIIRDEEVLFYRDGKGIWISASLAPIRDGNDHLTVVVFTFIDITKRKRQADEILASEREFLKVTLNSLAEGVLAADQDGKVILINKAAANLTGFPTNEAIGQPLHQIFYLLDDKTGEPVGQIPIQAVFSQFILVTRVLRKVAVSLNSAPIKTSDGRIIGTVIAFQDITEKQRTDQELLKTEKLESIGILAGGIAHDFNNLLAAILSNIQLAQMKYKKNADIEKYLQESVESTRRASELTRQLLTFSKGGAPVKKAASLAELIRDTTTFALRGSNVKVDFQIPDTLWPVEADTGQISQVIHNLVINAKQAMPKGGKLQISAENITIESGLRFHPGNYLKIAVKDHGAGISKENLPRIFDPFFTTKKEGSGLGLTTSYSIIRRHDGYLEVESEASAWTTFHIYLPALMGPINLSEIRNEVAVTNQGFKILFMEDEEAILHSVGEMLQHYGHQVVLAKEGSKTIEDYRKAVEDGVPFDIVIMDLTIPGGMGGQETIGYLREFDPHIKAIVSSGYANDPILSEYERFGFCGVVTKPYKIDELKEVLYRVLERK